MTDVNQPTPEELAQELDEAPIVPPSEPPAGDDGSGPPPRDPGRKKGEIFENCPVTPLGVRGKFAYYLDGLGQLRAIDNHNAQNIMSLFGHHIPKLTFRFPQINAEGKRRPNRFDQTTASMVMHQAAAECGVFNPDNSVRGVGAWTDDDGQLIYHMGDKVLWNGKAHEPGRIEGRIYPASAPIPHPEAKASSADPVPPLLKTFESWNWTQPDLHPFLALGMLSTQILCGALDWRPVFWLLAPAGAGKSEFQRLLKLMHGDDGLIQSTDATKSGITSQLGQSSLPVSVDELEPGDERSSKEKQIIELARVAASGGKWLRGSADQSGVGGQVYSAFLFSSILIPGVMKSQDVQRLIKLEMKPLDRGAAKLGLDPRTWRARGARLKAILINRWPTWQERLASWRFSLEEAEVMGRDADNWSTVMAMADMAQNEEIAPEDVRASWAKKVAFQVSADRGDTVNDAEGMLLHLLSQTIDPFRKGQQFTIAQWIMAAGDLPATPAALKSDLGSGDLATEKSERQKRANAELAKFGLRVYQDRGGANLFIMNKPIESLKRLFQGSDWANGVWQQSAKRVPGAEPTRSSTYLAGIGSRGVMVPLKSIPGLLQLPTDRDAGAPKPPNDDLEDFG